MPRVVHFEFPSTNMEASRKFFEAVLGWKLEKWGDEEYWMATTGDPAKPGINGALYVPGEHMSGTVNTIDVDNLDAALKKVVENGGQVMAPRMEIPGVGFLAYVRDPGGAFFGLMEAMPGGMM
jgi:hypothetical protein